MDVIVREVDGTFLKYCFSPNNQTWYKQNPPAEYGFTNLGNATYFVKRQPRCFSGWKLLHMAIAGEQIRNAPRVISLAKDQDYYYYFTEKLEGENLDDYLKQNSVVRLTSDRLISDVFRAFFSISNHQFWYSDLCKKNIFVLRSGGFNLIDLDSCIPSEKPFFYNGRTSCEYPPLLKRFAREVRNIDLDIFQIQGVCVNQAEIIALAVDVRCSLRIPMDSKINVLHTLLMQKVRQEYIDLFSSLTDNKPDWVKAKKLVDIIVNVMP
jgi:Protein kinase domain.